MDNAKIVATYIKMRDTLAAKRKEFEAEEDRIKGQMKLLENVLLDHLNKTESNSVATDAGTFYRQEDIIPTCSDWEAFYGWIAEHNEFEALERRIKKTFVKDFMDQHEGETPPGVSVMRRYEVRIRRA